MYARDERVCGKWPGDVGDGKLPFFGEDPPLAVRWEEAADEGSRFESYTFPSWMAGGMCVGEWFLGVEPPLKSFFENVRDRLEPDFSGFSGFSGFSCWFEGDITG